MADSTPNVVADFPQAFAGLFDPWRYKVFYGGRGAGRSWSFSRALLIQGISGQIRTLCAREYMNSMKDSVHKVLCDQIDLLKINHLYEVQQAIIKGPKGTEFNFEGISHNTSKIKSYEGIDVCWIEEADNVSKASWEVIIPTIRKQNAFNTPGRDAEIWMSFNPVLETDETYKRFVLNPPANALVRHTTWKDNPYFPPVLMKEMEALKASDYDAYLNVWEGHCKQVVEGAVYADELRAALKDGRLTKVGYDPTKPVSTFWDIGYSDMTTIWFAQIVGFEYRIIDYYENRLKAPNHYLKVLQDKPYIYDTLWLPHDAAAKQFSAAGRSIEEQYRSQGFHVRIVPRHSLNDGIAAARTIFPICVFDSEKCEQGIQCLRHYHYDVADEASDRKILAPKPKHDWSSHGADGFRMLAMALKQPQRQIELSLKANPQEQRLLPVGGRGLMPASNGWMR